MWRGNSVSKPEYFIFGEEVLVNIGICYTERNTWYMEKYFICGEQTRFQNRNILYLARNSWFIQEFVIQRGRIPGIWRNICLSGKRGFEQNSPAGFPQNTQGLIQIGSFPVYFWLLFNLPNGVFFLLKLAFTLFLLYKKELSSVVCSVELFPI